LNVDKYQSITDNAMERIIEQINTLKNDQVKKLCDNIERQFHIDHKKLLAIWCLIDGKNECKITYSKTYDSNVVHINQVMYLISKDGVFGKVIGNDVVPITMSDEKICISNGYKVVTGIFNEELVV
jgi:hypothetical protein